MSGRNLDKDGQKDVRKELDTEWARSQVEAFVDGSLRGEQRARMRAVLAQEARVAAEVERARSVRAALRGMGGQRVPEGLRARLLAIASRRGSSWRARAVPALGVAAAALVAVMMFRDSPPVPDPEPEPRPVAERQVEQALEDFAVAMRYLRVGAERSREQLADAVGSSVRFALATSHDSLRESHSRDRNESNGG